MTEGAEASRPPGPPQAWQPRPYPQLLRGPTFRWWRPPLAVLVGVGAALVVTGLAVVADDLGADPDHPDAWLVTPVGLLVTNLSLAGLVPAVLLSVRLAYGWSSRWVSSVAPGLRRGWLLRCYLMALVLLGVPTVALTLLGGYRVDPEADWPWLVAVVLLTTPLQAAGEEYVFRGWIPLLIGSAVPSARVGALAGGAVSSGLFALAHGEQDVWLFTDRFVFGAVACLLVWRTGGLEAGIALHGANNLVALLLPIFSGDLEDTLGATEGTLGFLVFDVLTVLATATVVLLAARRWRIARLAVPASPQAVV